ncbi:unnamed protein product [Schistosoma curassoni]|uniref:MAM domain-containing protein n=1 Tax=Schistosoma curassoni TaxID=6186 RepID=A0A183KS08_9TREM|nr:unnamed protein product [Schistosoma curassoni]
MIMSPKALQMSSQVYSNVGNSVTTNTDPWTKRISSIRGRLSSNNPSTNSSNDNLSCLPRLFCGLFAKLFSGNDNSSTLSLKYHSTLRTDLSRFQNSAGSSSSYVQRNNILNWCLRLVLLLLILSPLLLILSLLFAPTDNFSNNSSLKLFPFFSDSNCTYELSETRPDSTHLWNLFIWKARCLYVRYFFSSELNEDNSRSDKENDGWQWIPFYSSSKSSDRIVFDAGNST